MRKLLFVLFVCALVPALQAQPGWTIYNTANSPIPENSIHCITFDAQGNKWIGTDNGLAFFDDVNWTVYDTSNSGLPDNYIHSIAIAPNGDAWIGTFVGGLARFDGTTWTVWNQNNSGLPNDFVRSIAFDTVPGIMWIGTSSGLARFDGTNFTVWHDQNSALLSNNVSCVKVGENNMKYISTINGGLYDFDGTTFSVYTVSLTGIPDNSAVEIALDSAGNRWYASPAAGFMQHYEANNIWSSYNTVNSNIASNALTSVFIDSLENKYAGSQQSGFIRFTFPATWMYWDTANSPMPDEYVQCVAKENNYIVWVGTREGGLVRVDESIIFSGITETEFEKPLLYPNPAQSGQPVTLALAAAMKSVRLFDLQGRRVETATHSGDPHRFVFAAPPAGIYIADVLLQSGGAVRTLLVVKE